ncbi:MAG TPA: glycosyltransferase family 9 protein [Pseudobdellovibrionaceae bacterium]|nr:glycosyltransferase family 9 protein [Pseudobdellovibrionaceae bacterium]
MRLTVQTAFLGDALLSIPLLRALRADAPLHLVVRKGLAEFFRNAELADEVFEVEKGSAASYSALARTLSAYRYRQIFAVHESFRTAHFVRSLKADEKIGFRKWWSPLFWDQAHVRPKSWPEALRALSLLQARPEWRERLLHWRQMSEGTEGGVGANGEFVTVPDWAHMQVSKLMGRARASRAVIAPGSVWATKRWTEDGFVEVARALREQNFVEEIVWSGSRDEAELCTRLAERVGGRSLAGELNIWQTAELMAESKLVISNDSGAQHLACTSDTPVVSIFGPTVLEFGYRPWSNRARVVQESGSSSPAKVGGRMSCRPCGTHGARQCPIGTHACMKNVEAQMVIEAVRSVLLDSRAEREGIRL